MGLRSDGRGRPRGHPQDQSPLAGRAGPPARPIYTECYHFLGLGYITPDGLRNLTYLYKTYHTMGGNGTGTELYNRAKALPIHD